MGGQHVFHFTDNTGDDIDEMQYTTCRDVSNVAILEVYFLKKRVS